MIDRKIQWAGLSTHVFGQVDAGIWKTTYVDAHELHAERYDQ